MNFWIDIECFSRKLCLKARKGWRERKQKKKGARSFCQDMLVCAQSGPGRTHGILVTEVLLGIRYEWLRGRV